jgi:tetratricopeptide (TPR) repeat protein
MNEPVPASAMDELQKDPALAPILANTRGKKLYAALKLRLAGENNPTRRRLLEEVLANRRWFLEPITRAPSLSTVNGIGTMLYGESEKEADGTYIATLFFVFVFIPIFPIAQYLVRDLGGRKWSFFGKVPASSSVTRWRRAVGLGVLLTVAAAALAGIESSSHSNVQFVNGLDVPVTIHAGKIDLALKANDRASRRMSSGDILVKVTSADGRVFEEEKLKVPGATDLVVYNVLGAAPLYRQPISYYAAGHEGNDKDEPILESGKKVIIENHVDYVFSEPPKEIEMPSGSNMQRRWRFDLAPGGWKLSAAYLMSQKKGDDAAKLAEAVASVSPDDEATLNVVATVVERAKGSDEMFAFAQRLAEKFPESIEPQRLYQSLQMMKGGRAELVAKYRERAEKNPGSATAGYLATRLELPAEALPHYQELQKKFPDNLHVQRGLAWVLLQLRKFSEAAVEFERLAKLPHTPLPQELEGQASALIALGKAKEAAEIVAAHAAENPANKTLYARVAHVAGEAEPDRFIDKSGASRSWYEALFGDFAKQPPLDGPEQGALSVLAAMRQSGRAALAALDKAGPDAASYIDRAYVLVLAAEAVREKDRARAVKILDDLSPPSTAIERAAILDGKDSPEITDMQLDVQSVMELARGWRLGDRKLVEQARADDLFKGAVAVALGWR